MEVLEIHANQIELYGGSPGIRDIGLLEAAVAQPQASFGDQYLHKDLFEMAATYLYHLVQNHPFIDGNKRVGLVTTVIFLELNGFELDSELDSVDPNSNSTPLQDIVLKIASGEIKKPEIAKFLERKTNIQR